MLQSQYLLDVINHDLAKVILQRPIESRLFKPSSRLTLRSADVEMIAHLLQIAVQHTAVLVPHRIPRPCAQVSLQVVRRLDLTRQCGRPLCRCQYAWDPRIEIRQVSICKRGTISGGPAEPVLLAWHRTRVPTVASGDYRDTLLREVPPQMGGGPVRPDRTETTVR